MLKIKNLFPIFAAVFMFSGCSSSDLQSPQITNNLLKSSAVKVQEATNKYIVVLNENVDTKTIDIQTRRNSVTSKAQEVLNRVGVSVNLEEVYQSALKGFTVRLTPSQAKLLAADKSVKLVEPDGIMSVSPIIVMGKPGSGTTTSPAQVIPLGITRVGGGTTTSKYTAWIIDTGIDLKHPDLKIDATRSASFLGRGTNPNDQNGHGTHVSGIIAAINNSIGVVGVAPGTTLVAVRVLDKNGSGTTSGVIAGVDYVAEKGVAGDVANMSLGGSASSALDQAVLTASANVKFVLAAGNNSANANNYSPARVNGPNIYTISAMDSSDNWAYFSNFGNPPIDFCAPGVSIYSTYIGESYATLSGTSMAAPHVTGLLLLGPVVTSGYVKNDPDGNPDPIAHH